MDERSKLREADFKTNARRINTKVVGPGKTGTEWEGLCEHGLEKVG